MQRYSLPNTQLTHDAMLHGTAPKRTPLSIAPDDAPNAPVPRDWGKSVPRYTGNTAPTPVSAPQAPTQRTTSVNPHTPQSRTVPTQDAEFDSAQVHHDMVLFVRGVLNEAIQRGASDVHIEPRTTTYRIRFRVDGVLHDFVERPGEEYATVVSTLKVLADLDIAERILPQDGHIELVLQQIDTRMDVGGRNTTQTREDAASKVSGDRYYDIRVSVFPSVNGEVIVMRILNRASALLSVEELGMDSASLEGVRNILLTSYGMVLITGPTGSGKTTTLYSVMSELKSEDRNIITLEDPIEFHLDWMRQCEIREERGLTFERAMQSVLRQDPDVLMVGEIRDPMTAEYAVRSALVGRIVGSTIHANTTVGTIARLLDLGISRSLLANSIQGIIAQRLVRRVCTECKVPYTPQTHNLAHFGLENAPGPYYRGKGCESCQGSGFKGRTGIFSVMLFSDEIRAAIFEQRSLSDVQDIAIKDGMRTLKMDAAMKITTGVTTVEEAIRVV